MGLRRQGVTRVRDVDALCTGLSPELSRLVTQLWGRDHQRAVVVCSGRLPQDLRMVEQYVAFPSLRSAKFLVPADSLRVAAGSLLCYRGLRRRRTQLLRLALVALLPIWLRGHRIRVCVPQHYDEAATADVLMLSEVTRALGRQRLVAAIGVGNPGPNRKPTLQLFDMSGQPTAFVKVGWNELTRAMVVNEAAALRGMSGLGLALPRRPEVLLHVRWHDVELLAAEPLPLDARQLDPYQPAPAEFDGPEVPAPLNGSKYWNSVRDRIVDLSTTGAVTDEEMAVVRAYAHGVQDRWSTTEIRFAPWHGDWSFWNMARADDELWVWDWEHFAESAPRGMDTFHFHFQRVFIRERRRFHDALTEASARCTVGGQPSVVASVYPLELYLRAAAMHVGGAGWNPRFHDDAVRWLKNSA